MAASDGSILLTIRSAFRDEGFKKADAAMRTAAGSARRATDSFQKVTAAMGTLGGQAGRVGSQIAGIFSSFAAGGVVGAAVAGLTAVFGHLVAKMEEAKAKADETARRIVASFAGATAALKGAFSVAGSVADAKSARSAASTAAFQAESATRSSAAVRDVRQGAAIAAAGAKTPDEAKVIQLRAEVEAAKLAREQSVEAATVRRNAAGDRLAEAQSAERRVRDEAAAVDRTHAGNIGRMESYVKAYDSGRAQFAESMWGGGWLYDKFGTKKTREDVGKALEAERKARSADADGYALKKYKAASATFSARDAYQGAEAALSAAKGDRSVEVAEANLAAETRRQAESAKKSADVAKKREEAERKKSAHIDETNRKLAEYDRAIAAATDAAAANAARIANIQGAVAGGATIPEIARGQADADRDRAANVAKARRNLLGKVETARRNGRNGDLKKWQGMLDDLDGKNPAADKAADLKQSKDELQKQSVQYLKQIAESMANLGL